MTKLKTTVGLGNYASLGLTSILTFKANTVYSIDYRITSTQITGLPAYGKSANLTVFNYSGLNGGFASYLFVNEDKAFFGFNKGSNIVVWHEIFDTNLTKIKANITSTNHTTYGINDILDFEANGVYSLYNVGSSITGLPIKTTLPAFLSVFSYNGTNAGYTSYTYACENNYWLGFNRGSSIQWKKISSVDKTKQDSLSNLGLATKKIVIFGDSITAGVGGTGYAQDGDPIAEFQGVMRYQNLTGVCWANSLRDFINTNYPNTTCINNGIGGLNLGSAYSVISDIVPSDTDIAIMALGINNRGLDQTFSQAMGSFYNIAKYCEDNGIKLIVLTPIRALPSNDATFTKNSYQMRSLIKTASTTSNIECIDVGSEFDYYLEDKSITFDTTILPDGLHPNDTGHGIMYKVIKRLLGV